MKVKCAACNILMEEVCAAGEKDFFIEYTPAEGAPEYKLR